MVVLNFSHPLTHEQCARIEALAGAAIDEVRTIPVKIDQSRSLAPQITELVETLGLSSYDWQTRPLLVNPPSYAPACAVLLAELHGRMGHFPSLICLRPRAAADLITTYEVAELLNLQAVREATRRRR